MTIETGPAPTGVKTPSSSEAGAAKGKSSATGPSKGGVHTGFSAILESLGSDAPTAVAASSDATALPSTKADPTDVSVLDASALLAQSLQIPAQPVADGADPSAHLHAPAGKPLRPSDLAVQGASDKTDTNPLLPSGHGQQDARAKSALAASAKTAQAAQTAQGATDGQDAAARQPKFDAALEAAKTQQPAMDPGITLAALPSVAEKQTHERSGSATESNSGGTASPAPLGVASTGTAASGAVPDSAPAPDIRAAEQVTYWISQDVQNAEMKLDGVGEKPVEVSISMQGNEAQVAFRTDEVQTRAVLESASAHLKDMLQREGVTLTGVSVGTSSAGDSGGQERRPRQGSKQALVDVAQTASPIARTVGAGGAGRAVDLFV